MLNHSDYIDRVVKLIEASGVSFDLHNQEKVLRPDEYGGRIDYAQAKIWIHCPKAPEALRVIAHEGGHWVSFLLYGHDSFEEHYPRAVREVLADHYGWELLCEVGADQLVNHASWLNECRQERNNGYL